VVRTIAIRQHQHGSTVGGPSKRVVGPIVQCNSSGCQALRGRIDFRDISIGVWLKSSQCQRTAAAGYGYVRSPAPPAAILTAFPRGCEVCLSIGSRQSAKSFALSAIWRSEFSRISSEAAERLGFCRQVPAYYSISDSKSQTQRFIASFEGHVSYDSQRFGWLKGLQRSAALRIFNIPYEYLNECTVAQNARLGHSRQSDDVTYNNLFA
jgi:hypothetical protein